MTQKHNHFTMTRFTASALVLLVIAAASAVVLVQHNHTEAASSVKPGVGAAVTSKFSSVGTTGWWQGATNETSMALFQSSHDCFVSAQFNTGTVDVAAELQKIQTMLTSQGYTVTPDNTQTLTLQTTTGPQQYELHQSSVTTPAGAKAVQGGQEFGYIQLSGGYVKVEGYCNSADQLSATIPALQTIKFNENN